MYPRYLIAPQNLIFLSNRRKGFIDGANIVFPDSPHGYYMRRLADNMRKEGFKQQKLYMLLYKMTGAPKCRTLTQQLVEIKNVGAAWYNRMNETADKMH